MTNYELNSFYLVDKSLYDHFYQFIKQNEAISQIIFKKEKNNPFYLDFLRDTWFLFYCHPQNLMTDSFRSFYLLLRKTILDIASTDQAFINYHKITTHHAENSLYYATLLCECTSLYFKKALHMASFNQHTQQIASSFYTGDFYEKNYVSNIDHEPLYVRAKVTIMREMLKKDAGKQCEITQIFLQYAKRNLTQHEILSLNKESVLLHIYRQ